MTILQKIVATPKLWKDFYLYNQYNFNVKIPLFGLKSGEMLLAVSKNCQFYETWTKKVRGTFC